MTLFVGFLIQSNKKSTTIKSYVLAIKLILQDEKIKLNQDDLHLLALTRACRLNNDIIKTRLPIRKSLLKLLVKAIDSGLDNLSPYRIKLHKAILVTAYYGLFRIGELTFSEHAVRAKDVHVGTNKKKMLFVLHSSKTHDKGSKPQLIKVTSMPTAALPNFKNTMGDANVSCPFEILNDYIAVRKKRKTHLPNEQFFIYEDRSPVYPDHFRCVLKKALKSVKIDASYYTSHSLCAG